MAKIKVNITGKAFTGKVVTCTAPCGCDQVTDGLVINGETYTVCDAMGECVTGKGGAWCAGAQISVVLDCENKKAFIQNAASPNLKDALNSHIDNQNNPHNVTADQVAVTENVVNAFKETGNWSVDGILAQIGSTLFGGDVLYRWMRGKGTVALNTTGDLDCGAVPVTMYQSSEVSVEVDGTISLVNPTMVSITEMASQYNVPSGYFYPNTSTGLTKVYRATSSTRKTVSVNSMTGKYQATLSNVETWLPAVSGNIVTSEDPNTYTDGYVDDEGYTYTALDPITAFVPRIQTGSYTGTGTYGASNPTQITASFSPKLVVISAINSEGYNCSGAIVTPTGGFGYGNASSSTTTVQPYYLEGTIEGNTIKFYSRQSVRADGYQQNMSGYTYDFMVFG